MRPSYKDHPAALAAFRRELSMPSGSVEAAVRAACGAGGYVSEEDLRGKTGGNCYVPTVVAVERLKAEGDWKRANELQTDDAIKYLDEQAALAASRAWKRWSETTSVTDDERRRLEEAEQARLRHREEYAQREGQRAFDMWLAAMKEQHIEGARNRFDEIYPSRLPPPVPAPPPDAVQARAVAIAMEQLTDSAPTNTKKRVAKA